ncbi:MAG: 4-oxalocrotonate tautomerase family protein [Helicobacteraceae bacterium]|jgi:4-oxalocrotonate tautomerase|nr:4-oxalocrotonate tautomerase family protein [Helicobacteraceae bacterium]
MPYISVRVAGALTIEQKREIAKEFSETMERVAGKPKPACYIVFDEVARENWAKGETILSDQDASRANGS